jgi:predicted O-methyltransferase YrrM
MSLALRLTRTPEGHLDLCAAAYQYVEYKFRGHSQPQYFYAELTADEQTNRRGKPRPYIECVLTLLQLMKAKTIVEIGSMRLPLQHDLNVMDPRCCNDGHSTAYWSITGCDVYTVDVDPACADAIAQSCKGPSKVHVTTGDGIAFLEQFPGTIDLLYLDAWDVHVGDPYAERHLDAYQAARGKLNPASVILIDDTDILFGGKGRLAVPAMIRDGYTPIIGGRQTLLVRNG